MSKELEKDFQGWVLDVAARGKWRVWHSPMPVRPIGGNKFIPDPRGRGLPDLVMMHSDPPRLIFAELKSEAGVVGEAQKEFFGYAQAVANWAHADRRVGDPALGDREREFWPVRAFVWRPAHRDVIERLLLGGVTT